jgi:glycosyltransferase involved in cell wall biosynthesis
LKDINILHSVSGVGKSSFGLGQVVKNMAKAQLTLASSVDIWCFDNADDINWAAESSGFPLANIRGFSLTGPKMFWFTPEMERAASGLSGRKFDVIHQHGIWTGASRATIKLREKNGVPAIIAPHGSLSRWTLSQSAWKKKIALSVYESRNLHQATCLHATSQSEINDFRDFGLVNPIAYIQNGITEESLIQCGNAEEFRRQYSIASDRRILLFLSRITPKKGLLMLVETIARLNDNFSNWQLIIAGVDEFGHKSEVEQRINDLSLTDSIKIIGPLFDQTKADAFSAADLFILPSLSEGFPMVVLDSLAAGVPVITTKSSSWEELNTYECGWWVDISHDAIYEAIRSATILSSEQLKEMGLKGKKLVSVKYTWSSLAQKTLDLYDWLLHRRDMPNFVLLD